MIVTQENLSSVLESIGNVASIDCETTGLRPYHDDRLFSVIVSVEDNDYYFNFHDYQDGTPVLDREASLKQIAECFASKPRVWFLQNAKFDMAFLAKEGVELVGYIFDLQVIDRIHFNQHQSYRLFDIASRWGFEKLDVVEKYLEENKKELESEKVCLRSGKVSYLIDFTKVPSSLIIPYGKHDGKSTLGAGKKIMAALDERQKEHEGRNLPSIKQLIDTESKLTKVLFDMEKLGVKLDEDYCREAKSFYQGKVQQLEATFKAQTGLEFCKGTTVFEEVFANEQDKWKKTEKGNWRWDSDIVSAFRHPAAKTVIEHSEAKKQLDYFTNFLYFMDSNCVLHTNFKQSGTVTGRLSSSDVNLQNLTNPDKYEPNSSAGLYPVRRAFVPRDGFFFAMIDYSQSEFRLFLDYAKPENIIQAVRDGLDVHEATAQSAGVSRKEAKMVNFLTVYGGGVAKLVAQLYEPMGSQEQVAALFKKINGWRFRDDNEAKAYATITDEMRAHDSPLIEKAYKIQQSIFGAAPELKKTLKQIQSVAEDRGWVMNWAGRRMYFPDKRWCYKAPNHVIQGGGADMMKLALVKTAEYLANKKSRIVLTIHDEIILEVANEEAHEVPQVVCDIMGSVYPYKCLPQVAEIGWNDKNLANKLKWEDYEQAARNSIQGEGT